MTAFITPLPLQKKTLDKIAATQIYKVQITLLNTVLIILGNSVQSIGNNREM